MSTFIEFNSADDLPIKAIQKLNHNFKNINGSETSATVVRIIEDTVAPFEGATSQDDGTEGLVPAPQSGEECFVLKGDGSWSDIGDAIAAAAGESYPNGLVIVEGLHDSLGSHVVIRTLEATDIPSLAISKITNLQTTLNAKAPLASPVFAGTPVAPTAPAGTNTTQIATTAFVQSALSDVAGALVYKGTVGTGGTVTDLPASHTKGWYYIVKAAGTFAGVSCESGDMIICHETRATANNSDWDVIQTNVDVITNAEIDAIAV